jgi:hypothetical protein
MNLSVRTKFGNKLNEFCSIPMPNNSQSPLLDFEIRIED